MERCLFEESAESPWQRFRCPATEELWWFNEDSDKFFYETSGTATSDDEFPYPEICGSAGCFMIFCNWFISEMELADDPLEIAVYVAPQVVLLCVCCYLLVLPVMKRRYLLFFLLCLNSCCDMFQAVARNPKLLWGTQWKPPYFVA